METEKNNQPQPPETLEKQGEDTAVEDEINVYPTIRHVFLILCILLTIAIIVFLFYQNGSSIYDNGI